MALWRPATFESMEAMIDYMNGALMGTVNLDPEGADVDGKTLKIDPGTGTVTVSFGTKGRNWTLEEIVAEIEGESGLGGIASIKILKVGHSSFTRDRRLLLVGDPAITLIANGTANAELGFVEGTSPADDTDQVITPQAAVERMYRNVDGQDTWTVVLYS